MADLEQARAARGGKLTGLNYRYKSSSFESRPVDSKVLKSPTCSRRGWLFAIFDDDWEFQTACPKADDQHDHPCQKRFSFRGLVTSQRESIARNLPKPDGHAEDLTFVASTKQASEDIQFLRADFRSNGQLSSVKSQGSSRRARPRINVGTFIEPLLNSRRL